MNESIKINKTIAQIIANLCEMNGGQFIGFKEYVNGSGEVANHVVQANFSYGKAKKDDFENKLQNISTDQIDNVISKLNKNDFFASEPVTIAEIKELNEKLLFGYFNPKAKTEKQEHTYTQIADTTLRVHNETGEIHAYALAISKKILVEGEYKKPANSRRNTRIQNAIKKELNFTTLKFRQFKISPENLGQVAITGNTYQII